MKNCKRLEHCIGRRSSWFFGAISIVLSLSGLTALACTSTVRSVDSTKKPIVFHAQDLFPEGITALPDGSGFLVTSLKKGRIGKVDWQGNYSVLVDDAHLISALGVKVDARRGWIIVANGDPGVSEKRDEFLQAGTVAGLGIYQLDDGKLVQYIDLAAVAADGDAHIANDLVIAPNGDIYVTDSFAPIIYKVDSQLQASVFARHAELWSGEGFGLNGLVYDEGYLVVLKYNSGELFRISARDGNDVRRVDLPQKLPGADGATLLDGKLYITASQSAQAEAKRLYLLSGRENWSSAELLAAEDISSLTTPTTNTSVGTTIYYIDAKLDTLFGGGTADDFTIYPY